MTVPPAVLNEEPGVSDAVPGLFCRVPEAGLPGDTAVPEDVLLPDAVPGDTAVIPEDELPETVPPGVVEIPELPEAPEGPAELFTFPSEVGPSSEITGPSIAPDGPAVWELLPPEVCEPVSPGA